MSLSLPSTCFSILFSLASNFTTLLKLLLSRVPVVLVLANIIDIFSKIWYHWPSSLSWNVHSLWFLGHHVLLVFLLSRRSPSTCLLYMTSLCWSSGVLQDPLLVLVPLSSPPLPPPLLPLFSLLSPSSFLPNLLFYLHFSSPSLPSLHPSLLFPYPFLSIFILSLYLISSWSPSSFCLALTLSHISLSSLLTSSILSPLFSLKQRIKLF